MNKQNNKQPNRPMRKPKILVNHHDKIDIHQEAIMQLLLDISNKTDAIDLKLDTVRAEVIKKGAMAGAVAGGISGGIVATAIAVIRTKLGL